MITAIRAGFPVDDNADLTLIVVVKNHHNNEHYVHLDPGLYGVLVTLPFNKVIVVDLNRRPRFPLCKLISCSDVPLNHPDPFFHLQQHRLSSLL